MIADRVKESTTTTGTGSVTLGGASSGYQTFASGIASNSPVDYCLVSGGDWETGRGTFTAPSTLTRDQVYASSGAGAKIALSGTSDVFVTVSAETMNGKRELHGFNLTTAQPTSITNGLSRLSLDNGADVDLAYDPATRVVTLTQTGGLIYWYKGQKVVTPSPVSTAAHSATAGAYWIYFSDTSGIPTISQSPWDLTQHTPITEVYYNGTTGVAWEERHAAQRDPHLHKYLHQTQGAKKVSGFGVSGYTLENGTANSMVQYAVAAGVVADEDIQVTCTAETAGGPYTIWYRTPTGWTFDTTPSVPYKAGTYIQYDNSGTLTDLAAGELVNYWIFATTSLAPAHQIFALAGQAKYSTLGPAIYEGFDDLLLSGFPSAECVPLYRVTYQADAAFATTGKAAIVAVIPVAKEFAPERMTTDYLDITAETGLANPIAGHTRIFGKILGKTRVMPAAVGPSGTDYTLQPSIWRQKIARWNPAGNSNGVPGVDGFNAWTAVGTATARNVATTNLFTRMKRLGYVSAATAGSLTSVRAGQAQFTTGNGAGLGGFFYSIRFARSDAAAVTGVRFFAGMSATTGAPTNVEPSTLVNAIGLAQLSTSSSSLYVIVSGSAAQTAIDLGAAFPPYAGTPGVTTGVPYDFMIWAPPGSNGVVNWQLDRLDTQTSVSGTVTPATLGVQTPANTTLLGPVVWACNNATALACAFDISNVYLETDF